MENGKKESKSKQHNQYNDARRVEIFNREYQLGELSFYGGDIFPKHFA